MCYRDAYSVLLVYMCGARFLNQIHKRAVRFYGLAALFAILDVADVCVIHFSLMPKHLNCVCVELSKFQSAELEIQGLIMLSPSHYHMCMMILA